MSGSTDIVSLLRCRLDRLGYRVVYAVVRR